MRNRKERSEFLSSYYTFLIMQFNSLIGLRSKMLHTCQNNLSPPCYKIHLRSKLFLNLWKISHKLIQIINNSSTPLIQVKDHKFINTQSQRSSSLKMHFKISLRHLVINAFKLLKIKLISRRNSTFNKRIKMQGLLKWLKNCKQVRS